MLSSEPKKRTPGLCLARFTFLLFLKAATGFLWNICLCECLTDVVAFKTRFDLLTVFAGSSGGGDGGEGKHVRLYNRSVHNEAITENVHCFLFTFFLMLYRVLPQSLEGWKRIWSCVVKERHIHTSTHKKRACRDVLKGTHDVVCAPVTAFLELKMEARGLGKESRYKQIRKYEEWGIEAAIHSSPNIFL